MNSKVGTGEEEKQKQKKTLERTAVAKHTRTQKSHKNCRRRMNLVSTAAGSHRPTHARIIDRFAVDGEEDGRFFFFPKTASHTPLSLSLSLPVPGSIIIMMAMSSQVAKAAGRRYRTQSAARLRADIAALLILVSSRARSFSVFIYSAPPWTPPTPHATPLVDPLAESAESDRVVPRDAISSSSDWSVGWSSIAFSKKKNKKKVEPVLTSIFSCGPSAASSSWLAWRHYLNFVWPEVPLLMFI